MKDIRHAVDAILVPARIRVTGTGQSKMVGAILINAMALNMLDD
ncbi:hypothetical protein [Rhodoferax sp.]|nr:hypothetical protein [Rhodoferax sp.]